MSQTAAPGRLVGMNLIAKLTAWALALFLGGNGVAMMAAPQPWYVSIPGVTLTGPYNGHFVRDVGATYIIVAGAIVWTALHPRVTATVALAAAWLCMHATVHVIEAATCGRPLLGELLRDLPGIYVPAMLALWLTGLSARSKGGAR